MNGFGDNRFLGRLVGRLDVGTRVITRVSPADQGLRREVIAQFGGG